MISSDPDLDGNHMLVRINEVKRDKEANNGREEAKKKCLVSVAEREHAPAANSSGAQTTELAPNYFSVGPDRGRQPVRQRIRRAISRSGEGS